MTAFRELPFLRTVTGFILSDRSWPKMAVETDESKNDALNRYFGERGSD